jgi:hypothetical protein
VRCQQVLNRPPAIIWLHTRWTISTPASLPTLDTGYGRAARRARYKTEIL